MLHWAALTLPPPRHAPADIRPLGTVSPWVVRAWEPDPPAGAEALEWVLLSSLPVTGRTEARRTVDCYTCRGLDEDYHQCLKTGCQIERKQFNDGATITRWLGVAAPIAVRLLQVRQAARHTPEVPATTVVDPLLVRIRVHRQKLQTEWQALSVAAFWQAVARLGGHPGRRRDGPRAGARCGAAGISYVT